MATIKEIAKACNVSIATVSNALNDKSTVNAKTRAKVLEAAKHMEYVPNFMAKNLKQKSTKVIGIITEDLTVFNCPEIVDGIHAYLEEMNYSFLLGNLRLYKKYGNQFYSTEKYKTQVFEEFRIMMAKQVEGIIYIGAHSRELRCIPKELSAPIVLAYGFSTDPHIPSVVLNDEKAAFDATNKLIESGHDIIGIIAGEEKSLHTKDRLLGFQRALYQHKILFNPELVYYGNWMRDSGQEGAAKLLGLGVTAIFAMNDMMAGGIYDYAYEKEIRIGRELSVIGMDNKEISSALRPSLTTMALPLYEIGRESARIVIELCNENDQREEHIHKIECRLMERDSISKTF